MNVSDLLIHILAAHGVRRIFGIPGDVIDDLMEAIRRQGEIRFIGVRQEEAGAFAASAEAKLTGGLAACVGTAGPGAIHLLNGLYDAKRDHAPVIAITGQEASGFIGTEAHQEVDLERLFFDVAVYSETVTNAAQAPEVLIRACHAAIADRGIAHVSIPTDVAGKRVAFDQCRPSSAARPGHIVPAAEDCAAAGALLRSARKVAILAGTGCAGAGDALVAFALKAKAPIVRSLRAEEVIDDDHPLCVGRLGLLGDRPEAEAMANAMADCDLLVMVGGDFPDLELYPQSAKAIQIDTEPTRIGRRRPVDVGLVGQAGPTLEALTAALDDGRDGSFLGAMQSERARWRASRDAAEASTDRPINATALMRAIVEVAPDDTIFLADSGTATAWTARHLRIRPGQRYILSGGPTSMAFAFPGAIGAQLAYPERRVIAIAGDGAFAMLLGDFVTAVEYRLPIVTVVLDNGGLGFIGLEREAKGLPAWGSDLLDPDFAAVAEASGGFGRRVEAAEEMGAALAEALAAGKPAVLEVRVNREELVMPPEISLSQAADFGLAAIGQAFRR